MKPVLVTTEHRGVFFGWVPEDADLAATTQRIERARMAVYWSADVQGVLGLAAGGPTAGCRIGPEVPAITLAAVTAVVECSPEAARAWEVAAWAR